MKRQEGLVEMDWDIRPAPGRDDHSRLSIEGLAEPYTAES